jgi:hypothetical protein
MTLLNDIQLIATDDNDDYDFGYCDDSSSSTTFVVDKAVTPSIFRQVFLTTVS